MNLAIVFLVSGFWHGAAWTFVFWGALHAVYVVSSSFTSAMRARWVRAIRLDRLPSVHAAIQVLITFHLVCFSWVFFRSESFGSALAILEQLPKDWLVPITRGLGFGLVELIALGVVVAVWLITRMLRQGRPGEEFLGGMRPLARWACYLLLGAGIVLLGAAPENFVYFQF
jgi:hypothetical protein